MALVGTLLVLNFESPGHENAVESIEAQAVTAALSVAVPVGQGLLSVSISDLEVEGEDVEPLGPGEAVAAPVPQGAPPWQHFVIGLDEAFEEACDRPPGAGEPKAGTGDEVPQAPPVPDGSMGLWTPINRASRGVLMVDRTGVPAPASPPESERLARIEPAPEASARGAEVRSRLAEREDSWLIPVTVSWVALTTAATGDAAPRPARRARPDRERWSSPDLGEGESDPEPE